MPKPLCFVAMPFNNETVNQDVQDAIKNAIESPELGHDLSYYRVDEDIFNGSITNKIVEKIFSCRLMVCDITSWNANVMFELGLAMALNKDIFLIYNSPEDFKVPFDLSAQNILSYKNGESGKLRTELIKRVAHILEH